MKAGEAHRRGFEPRRIRFGVEAVHQHARCMVAMDRTCTDRCPRGTSPTTGIAKEERPPGRSRENRTLASTGMSRDGAPARTAIAADEKRSSGAAIFRAPRMKGPVTKRQRPAKRVRSCERAVPPRGLEPQPTSFAALCPFLGTVAEMSRSGGNRTLRSFAPNERTGAGLALPVIVSPEITAVADEHRNR